MANPKELTRWVWAILAPSTLPFFCRFIAVGMINDISWRDVFTPPDISAFGFAMVVGILSSDHIYRKSNPNQSWNIVGISIFFIILFSAFLMTSLFISDVLKKAYPDILIYSSAASAIFISMLSVFYFTVGVSYAAARRGTEEANG